MEIKILTLVFEDTKAPLTKALVRQLPITFDAHIGSWTVIGTVQAEFKDSLAVEWVLFNTPRGVRRMNSSTYINSGYTKHFGEYAGLQRIILTK